MIEIPFMLHLVRDAELGSGLGTVQIDQTLTRDHQGQPIIRSTHLKGLMRQSLRDIVPPILQMTKYTLLDQLVFGQDGSDGTEGLESSVMITDARVTKDDLQRKTLIVKRTAINDLGVARQTSLRSSEALSAGLTLKGTLRINDQATEVIRIAAQLSLLSIHAVGAHRTRGAGYCYVTFDSNDPNLRTTPGQLLKALVAVKDQIVLQPSQRTHAPPKVLHAQGVTWLRLNFNAVDPVCCPDRPVIGLNVISSGLSIPASAVQGVILNHISKKDDALASACFASDRFRTWPLHPYADHNEDESVTDIPVRVALTHRMSKLADDNGQHQFADSSIEPYDWRDVPSGSPLKSSDGILIPNNHKNVRLWKAADIPRLLTAHGVHQDGLGERNLFTVESIAPLRWAGLMAVPSEIAAEITQVVGDRLLVRFGKARTVRGSGYLTVTQQQPPPAHPKNVYVVQSPLRIPDHWDIGRADLCLSKLVEQAGWGQVSEAWATLGIRFGWNRSRKGKRIKQTSRVQATRCILPGSVFVLKTPVTDVQLARGVGDYPVMGMGAILPHPGIATTLKKTLPTPKRKSSSPVGRQALNLMKLAGKGGPSPSQISSIIKSVQQGSERASQYLDRQKGRPPRTWRTWKVVFNDLKTLVSQDQEFALEVLKAWRDLTIGQRG